MNGKIITGAENLYCRKEENNVAEAAYCINKVLYDYNYEWIRILWNDTYMRNVWTVI